MFNEPKVLFNPTDSPIEFVAGGKHIIIEAGEKKMVDGFEAHIALEMTRIGLQEYKEGIENERLVTKREQELNKMTWVALRKYGAEQGVYKGPPMGREELTKLLLEHEGKNK